MPRGIAVPPGTGLLALLAAAWVLRWALRYAAAPARRGWRPGSGSRVVAGPLAVRVLGSGGPVVVLLHGLVSSGLEWGSAWDALAAGGRVVVPDLLGFGRSLAAPTTGYGVDEHLVALESCLAALGLVDEPVLLVGHSMGGVLALCWAQRRVAAGAPVVGVAAFCPPLFTGAVEADRVFADSDWVNRAMTAPGPLPQLVCRTVCGGGLLGKVVYVALNPQYPVRLAADGVHHVFDSYRGSLDALLRRPVWRPALAGCVTGGVPVLLAGGSVDHLVVPARHEAVAAREPGAVAVATRAGAGHDLPIADPHWCLRVLAPLLARGRLTRFDSRVSPASLGRGHVKAPTGR